jgi:hypothetical protein
MYSLPENGRNAHLITHVITMLLDHAGRRKVELSEESGIEPDYCF